MEKEFIKFDLLSFMTTANHISLSELNSLIREAIEMNFLEEVWLVAEIAEMRIAGAGHCYLDLVEKKNERIVARMRANIWKFQYERIATHFFASTGSNIKKGMKVLFSVGINFHEQYGISLVVKNIDPNYSFGDLARQKKEILEQLAKEKLVNKNGLLTLELVPKRVAVISSQTAAGYEDFMNQLTQNKDQYLFETTLFPTVMQGTEVEHSLVSNLSSIAVGNFDCVVIIRGGGASLDLAGFDNYNVGKTIANFPLPVLTGIGHERDETVADIVAHTKLKTPTAVADFLIGKMQDFEEYYKGLQEALIFFSRAQLSRHKISIKQLVQETKLATQKTLFDQRVKLVEIKKSIPGFAKRFIRSEEQKSSSIINRLAVCKAEVTKIQKTKLVKLESHLVSVSTQAIKKEKHKFDLIHKTIELVHPNNVLKRGYAMIFKNGNVVTDKTKVKEGEEIEIKWRDGVKKSKILEK